MKLDSYKAREILDSRGNPTLEVELFGEGLMARAAVPSGASTGAFEAHELRDEDPSRFLGKGVLQAKENVGKLFESLKGKDFSDFRQFDEYLIEQDGSENKSNLGANTLLGLSLAFAKLQAQLQQKELYQILGATSYSLPIPLMNVLNGGAHSNNGLEIQEFMIVPKLASFRESLRAGAEIFQTLKKIISKKSLSVAVGDEGGFAPDLNSNEEALNLLMQAIDQAGYKAGENVFLALDVAATEFFDEESSTYKFAEQKLKASDMISFYKKLSKDYPIISIEDGLAEEDWTAWQELTQTIGDKVQIVGDDLFVTNVKRITKGLELSAANALLVKPNQIGTLSETVQAVELMHGKSLKTVMSHRSGETEDVTIAQLCVGLNCSQIKTGSLCRGERTAKYNELLRISEKI